MQEPILRFLDLPAGQAGGQGRRLAYWDWPSEAATPVSTVVCVHGLSRQGRDFDCLARALRGRHRVVAVDVAGRGHSDRLSDPMQYQVPTYVVDLGHLLAHVRAQQPGVALDWVGTSMGGLIGIGLASQPATGLRRLVLNDVGPVIRWEALQRIGSYVGQDPAFASEQAGIDYLASISAGFGPHTAQQWADLSRPMLRQRDGGWRLHYDPAIAVPLRAMLAVTDPQQVAAMVAAGEQALWAAYDAIAVPTLLLRGADSDLLAPETAHEMTRRGPKAVCVEFPGVGHAPTLVSEDQIAVVRDFLLAPPAPSPGVGA
ncbi:MAG: alpha/beta hydrolase [Burkholderiales bacterium]|nr:MAG: alpha/beta hydrolase [Burkholderiales bacterium]